MHRRKKSAFTLIEVLVVLVLMGILTVTVVVAFTRSKDKAVFRDNQTRLINMFQKARSLAIGNLLIQDQEALYYLVEITEEDMVLRAENVSGVGEELERFTFGQDITVQPALTIFYFPPHGELCFDSECADPDSEKTFTISSEASPDYSSTLTVSNFSGLPELVEGDL